MTSTEYFQQSGTPHAKFHLYGLVHNQSAYLLQLQAIRANGSWSSMSSALKGTVLAALWMARCRNVVTDILEKESCGIAEISKALSILDNPRQKRQLRKKINRIERDHPRLAPPALADEHSADDRDEDKMKEDPKKEDNSTKRKRPRKIDKLRQDLHNLETTEKQQLPQQHNGETAAWAQDSAVRELYDSSSVSGALARHVRKWARTLKPDFLEFVMLEIEDKYHWQFVADLVHFCPGDFALPYFLADVHGESIPDDCFVSAIRKLAAFGSGDQREFAELFEATANKFPQIYKSYAGLRLKPAIFQNPKIIENLARRVPLETAIWYFEEMAHTSRDCATILKERLEEPGCVTAAMASDAKVYSFGKLMERILMFQKMGMPGLADRVVPIAKAKLSALREKWGSAANASRNEKKLAVLGDASSSMQCAIETATIFAGFLSALLDGELIFFNHEAVRSPHKKPSTVPQILDICHKIFASGATSLAAALGHYFSNKIWLDGVVLVTDEEENTPWDGRFFAQLFKEYRETVNPDAKLVVVCVGRGDVGFRASLVSHGIDHTTVQIDEARPDLTKFDALIGDIAFNCMGLALGGGQKEDAPAGVLAMDTAEEHESAAANEDDFVVVS